jgi:CPA2 family monovalent cation:H+ antiporter-2
VAAELLEVGVLFAAVAAVGALATRVRQSVIPFYILAGIVLGPSVAGALTERYLGRELAVGVSDGAGHFVALGAELGIVFLLFFLGLEFNLDRLVADRDRIGRAGAVDFAVNFGVGFGLGLLLFGSVLPAFVVAGMVYISSSAIITKSLIDLGWIANDESAPILGTLVYEDLLIAVYLAVLSALVGGGGGLVAAARSVGVALGFIVLLLLVASAGTAWFDRLLDTPSNEFRILRATGVTVFVGGAALAAGVSEAVAAFFVGMAFSNTDDVEALESLLEPVRDLFAAVFFFWIGLVTDPALFPGVAVLVAVAAVVTTPTKLASGLRAGRIYGLGDRRSMRVGLAMVTRGEFTLIVASSVLAVAEPSTTGPITADVARRLNAFAVGYVLVMSVLGTTLMQYSGYFERWVVRDRAGTG